MCFLASFHEIAFVTVADCVVDDVLDGCVTVTVLVPDAQPRMNVNKIKVTRSNIPYDSNFFIANPPITSDTEAW
ncbi:hypothetical protein ACFLWX_02745 [Chloroflexota bacterium]